MPNIQGGALVPNNNPQNLPALPPLASGSSGFGTPAALNNFSSSVAAATKPIGTISTTDGVSALTKTVNQANKLAPPPVTPPVTPATVPASPDTAKAPVTIPADTSGQTKVTLINPKTEQTITFNDAAINKDNIQSYMNSGYQLSEANGTVPDWLGPSGVAPATNTNSMLTQSNATLQQAQTDLTGAKTQLQNLSSTIGSDPQLQSILAGIGSAWDTRITDLQNTETSRIAALTTTGIRLGSQYTGGAGGMTGGIISAEEKQAINMIGDLNNQKQQALMSAQQAFESQKWTQYNDLVQNAQKSYDSILTQVNKLQDAQALQDQKIKDQQNASITDSNIASQYAKGVTNPADILAALKKGGDTTTTLDTIGKAITALTPPGIPDLVKTLTTNGAPGSVIQSVLKAGDLNSAYAAAGNYAAGGSGMVGEYNFYKAQAAAAGQTPVDFNTYQDMDANRKAAANATTPTFDFSGATTDAGVAGTGTGGGDILSATGLSYNGYLAITGQMSSLPRDAKTRNNATAEVQAFAKARGVDVSTLVSQMQAYNGTLKGNIGRFNNTQVMEGEITGTVDNLIASAKDFSGLTAANAGLVLAGQQVNDATAKKYQTQLLILQDDVAGYLAASRSVNSDGSPPTPTDGDMKSAASIIQNGISSGGAQAFKEAITDTVKKNSMVLQSNIDSTQKNVWNLLGVGNSFSPKLTSTQLASQESDATAAISAYVKQNPTQADAMAKAAESVNPKTNQPYTASEIAQIYGLDTSGTTGGSPLPTVTGTPSLNSKLPFIFGIPQFN